MDFETSHVNSPNAFLQKGYYKSTDFIPQKQAYKSPKDDSMLENLDLAHLQQNLKILSENKHAFRPSLFAIKSANTWINEAKTRPIPKKLFDVFWYEGEVCFLFADTNVGKSILAVQIAEILANGLIFEDFRSETAPQKVLYFDFELSDKQFEVRYSENGKNHYRFSEYFLRCEIDSDAEIPEKMDFETYLKESIEIAVLQHDVKVLIIDNITFLGTDNEKSKNALALMKHLKALKKKHQLSILCLGHTPKRDGYKPISRNDLQGSKMLINFVDSCFAIGESQQDKSLRYLKQIKARNTEMRYDSENVILCEIDKQTNFLGFYFRGYASELEHLKQVSLEDKASRNQEILELKAQGQSLQQIADVLHLSKTQVHRILKRERSVNSAKGTP